MLWASLVVVHITSANIYRPELSGMIPPNCKDVCSLGVCLRDKGVIFGGHIPFFATHPYTHNLKDECGIFPTSLTPEESGLPIITSEHQNLED